MLAGIPSAASGIGANMPTNRNRQPTANQPPTNRNRQPFSAITRYAPVRVELVGGWTAQPDQPPKFIITYARGFCQEKLFSKIHYVVVGMTFKKKSAKRFGV